MSSATLSKGSRSIRSNCPVTIPANNVALFRKSLVASPQHFTRSPFQRRHISSTSLPQQQWRLPIPQHPAAEDHQSFFDRIEVRFFVGLDLSGLYL